MSRKVGKHIETKIVINLTGNKKAFKFPSAEKYKIATRDGPRFLLFGDRLSFKKNTIDNELVIEAIDLKVPPKEIDLTVDENNRTNVIIIATSDELFR